MSETQASPQLTGAMYLFDKPELMNKEEHGGLGISRPEKRFGFCAAVRAIPITVTEIPAAAKDYPVVFASQENPIPVAVVGVIDDVNLFVDENGEWERFRYVPGYIRRYPFGVASEASGERMAIVIDRSFEGLVPGGEMPLFENDEPSPSTQAAIEFCKTFEKDRVLTEEFGKRLLQYGIVHNQSAQYTPRNSTEPQSFARYFGIDEEKLKELSDEQILELRKNGMLPLIHALMMSLSNWRLLLERRAQRFNLTDEQLLQPALN